MKRSFSSLPFLRLFFCVMKRQSREASVISIKREESGRRRKDKRRVVLRWCLVNSWLLLVNFNYMLLTTAHRGSQNGFLWKTFAEVTRRTEGEVVARRTHSEFAILPNRTSTSVKRLISLGSNKITTDQN